MPPMQPDDQERLARLESQVNYLLRYLGVDADAAADDAIPPQVAALIQQGKLIQAIKVYRRMTGLGLKEAKDAVDAMARALRGGTR
jgi:ribosomal protein L7/L12